ncbi:hypothetical protein Ciccas_008602 [Cichlidogyrus casuarinus]|uniref:Uncharacterized protein n=1 Tax=Cichlidogyrus casuarinus TaxID=1844966 RepID=A0ABD2PZG2_9PLAT
MNDRGLGTLVERNHEAYKREARYVREVKLDQVPTVEESVREFCADATQLRDATAMFPKKKMEPVYVGSDLPEEGTVDFDTVAKNLEIRIRDLYKKRVQPMEQQRVKKQESPKRTRAFLSLAKENRKISKKIVMRKKALEEGKLSEDEEVIEEVVVEKAKVEKLRNLENKQLVFLDLVNQLKQYKEEMHQKYVRKKELEEADRDFEEISEKVEKMQGKLQHSTERLRLLKNEIRKRISPKKWVMIECLIAGKVTEKDLCKVEEKSWNWYIE